MTDCPPDSKRRTTTAAGPFHTTGRSLMPRRPRIAERAIRLDAVSLQRSACCAVILCEHIQVP